MKLRVLFFATLVCPLALVAVQGQTKSVPPTAATDIPHLRKQGHGHPAHRRRASRSWRWAAN